MGGCSPYTLNQRKETPISLILCLKYLGGRGLVLLAFLAKHLKSGDDIEFHMGSSSLHTLNKRKETPISSILSLRSCSKRAKWSNIEGHKETSHTCSSKMMQVWEAGQNSEVVALVQCRNYLNQPHLVRTHSFLLVLYAISHIQLGALRL